MPTGAEASTLGTAQSPNENIGYAKYICTAPTYMCNHALVGSRGFRLICTSFFAINRQEICCDILKFSLALTIPVFLAAILIMMINRVGSVFNLPADLGKI